MKRKYLSLLLALTATIFAITGCGSDSEPSSSDKTTKPSTEIAGSIDSTESESENISEPESKSESVTEEPTEETTEEPVLDTSIQTLKQIGLLTATCETDINACYVDVTSKNPYDIVWDYGEEYEKYIAACDWSLVWDYDFYVKAFPALAELYHHDEALLLRHFQTVGIHEGRQGCENFYIESFINIEHSHCSYEASQFAYCYLDYMLNHDKYAENANEGLYRGFIEGVDDPVEDNHEKCLQHINIMTALEKQKLECIQASRKTFNKSLSANSSLSDTEKNDLRVGNLVLFDEATCFANLRAYLGAHDDYTGNDWVAANYMDYATKSYPFEIFENTVLATYLDYDGKLTYDTIIENINESSDEYKNYICNSWLDDIGISNIYYNPDTNRSSHVDVYSYYLGDKNIYQHRGYSGYMPYRFKY